MLYTTSSRYSFSAFDELRNFCRPTSSTSMALGIWREASLPVDCVTSSCVYTHTIVRILVCLYTCLAGGIGPLTTRGILASRGGRVGSVLKQASPLPGSSVSLVRLFVLPVLHSARTQVTGDSSRLSGIC